MLFQNIFGLILLICASVQITQARTANKKRIVNGYVTNISKVPYLMIIRQYGSFICGGSLIARRLVLTAAHCVTKGSKASTYTVTGGTTYLSREGVTRTVEKYAIPVAYRSSTLHMDAALLKLELAMFGDNIRIIRIHRAPLPPYAKVKVSGWGIMRENGWNLSNRVRSVELKVQPFNECKKRYRGVAKVTMAMFCASVPNGDKDACSGDSGGPVEYNRKLVGIVSWGVGCARTRYPGVYTSLATAGLFVRKARKGLTVNQNRN